MMQTLPITKARKNLPNLVDNVKNKLDEYTITVNGLPFAVLISAAEYESLKETNDILADPQLMKAIKLGEKEIAEGKGVPWEKVKKNLHIDV